MQDGSNKLLADRDTETADSGVTSVAISPDGRLVAAGSLDNTVRIWDVATGQLIERLRGHKDSVYSVAFTPDGDGIVSGSLDKTLKYWDVGKLLANAPKRDPRTGLLPVDRPGSSSVVKKEGDKASAACTMNFLGHKVRVASVSRVQLMTLSMIQDYVLSVAVSHDGQWVVSGSKDRGVQFWDSRSAIVQFMLQGHKNSGIRFFVTHSWSGWLICLKLVISIDLSPSASLLATGSGDWAARICTYRIDTLPCRLANTLNQGVITRYKCVPVAPVYCLSQQCLSAPISVYSLCRIYHLFLASSTCFFLSATIVCDRWRIGAVNVYNLSASIWDDHAYMRSHYHHHLSMIKTRMSLFTLNATSLLFLPTDNFQKCLFTSIYVHTTQSVLLLCNCVRGRLVSTARTTRYSHYMRKCSRRPLLV